MTDHARAIEAGARAEQSVNEEARRIRALFGIRPLWAEEGDREDLISYAKEVVALRAALASGELVPASAGQRVPLDWGKLVQCVLRCMDATIKNESSREQAERMATAIEERFAMDSAGAVAAERERCAKVADASARHSSEQIERNNEYYDRSGTRDAGANEACNTGIVTSKLIAHAIRALSPAPASEDVDNSQETFCVHNSDGSVSLDPYARMTRQELKRRCGELSRALNEWQFAAMFAATDGGNKLENIMEPHRLKIASLIEAYSDWQDEPPAMLDTAPASGEFVVVPRAVISGLLVDNDSDDDDDDCELCGGRGSVDAFTIRDGEDSQGRDEIGCPACIERHHSRIVRAAMLHAATKDGERK